MSFKSIEFFAGGGGLALGLEKAGFDCVALNDVDKRSCETLKKNRPHWNVICDDLKNLSFLDYKDKVDLVTGGFPCQPFTPCGKQKGFEDKRGGVFFDFARVINEIQPKIFLAENVKNLIYHKKKETFEKILKTFEELGYDVKYQVLKAVFYKVPQLRERIFIVGIKKNSGINFEFPPPNKKIFTLKDALKKGTLFNQDVPLSLGYQYSEKRKKILSLVPPGGSAKDLPLEVQKSYLSKKIPLPLKHKTGYAKKLSWDEPCHTLLTEPIMKITDRCHPDEIRPLTVREYARVQTFPDDWIFEGHRVQQYKQIGNAVPVNLAYFLGLSLLKALKNQT
jgi:DNA (cytosine-5)-methyltransferase 1